MINVCLAGATGWAGSELARGIAQTEDQALVAAVSRTHAGQDLGDVLGEPGASCPISASASEALLAQPCDVFVEFTRPESARAKILTALQHGVHVVVGTSGLTDEDYAEINGVARNQERGVLACGNFALTAVLLQKFAEMAARLIPHWEIIDYAYDGKPDAPSGTVRELAARLATVRQPQLTIPIDQTVESQARVGPRYPVPTSREHLEPLTLKFTADDLLGEAADRGDYSVVVSRKAGALNPGLCTSRRSQSRGDGQTKRASVYFPWLQL